MKSKLISLPRYYVTHFINSCPIGDCPLPDFVEVTDMYVKVHVNDDKLEPLWDSATKDAEFHGSPTVRKSALRTFEKIRDAKEAFEKASEPYPAPW